MLRQIWPIRVEQARHMRRVVTMRMGGKDRRAAAATTRSQHSFGAVGARYREPGRWIRT